MSTTALVLIARDEARCITRCLQSVRPWVDRMLVLDTGSTDSTIRLASEAGAEVGQFEWIEDFAAARNRALDLADADWNLVIDADEWLLEGGAALAALRDTEPCFIGQLRIDSEFDGDDGVGVAPSWISRVLPRGVRFAGRIHEQPDARLDRQRLAVRVGHDGYRHARQAAKHGRNERLLRLALASHADDPYLNYQLGKDLEQRDRFDAALVHYTRAYAAAELNATWRHDLVLRLVFALKSCQHWERAIALAESEMPQWCQSPAFYFALGDLLLDFAASRPSSAAELLPMIESSWLQCLALGERPDLEGSIQGCGSFLAAKNLVAFHASQGNEAKAAYFRALEVELRRDARVATTAAIVDTNAMR